MDPYEASETAMAMNSIQLHSPLARAAVDHCESEQHTYCRPSRYRNADGSCNNLRYPNWGKSFTCFQRLLPPAYADGQSAPRVSITGYPLPNPRVLSAVVHRDLNYPATYTHMVMQYGQFFAHDITFTPSSRTSMCRHTFLLLLFNTVNGMFNFDFSSYRGRQDDSVLSFRL